MFTKVISLHLVIEYAAEAEIDANILCRVLDENLDFVIEHEDFLRPWREAEVPEFLKSKSTLHVVKTRLRIAEEEKF